jgi:molybdopterin converting factor small subunit
MKFSINSIILWPRNNQYNYNRIPFKPDKVNIITGSSRTGKSAIIPIIDYCLGAEKCTIPVDIIRNSCAWFGVLFDLDNEQILLCRKEPGSQNFTSEMYLSRKKIVDIPEKLESNITVQQVKNILNELFSMSFLDIDLTRGGFFTRPSYRDFMAFVFQPQNIIANSDVLFYKADTSEHRQKLINIFPYALGSVTPQVLAARQEMERLRKEREKLTRDLNNIKDVAENWKQEVHSWIVRARELGLTSYVWNGQDGFEKQISHLRLIVEKSEYESAIYASNVKDVSDELIVLRKEEQEVSSRLFASQNRHSEMKQLSSSIDQYDRSLKIQLNRLDISTWLRTMASPDESKCPICGNIHSNSLAVLDDLCNAIAEIEKTAGDLKVIPAAFERESQIVAGEIQDLSEKMSAIRRRIYEESGKNHDNTENKFTLNNVARFLGGLEMAIQTYDRIGVDSELDKNIKRVDARLAELRELVNEREIERKINIALRYIESEANIIVAGLDAERPEDPIEFVLKDLTICVKNDSGRSDYLWEIGSASNWLAYHIAISLSFQKYFQERGLISIPNFLVFDQPSQVYFPQKLARRDGEKITDDESRLKDEDKEAVKKIFTTLSKYLSDTKSKVQIIVLEHADEDVWGDIENVHLVKRWRGNNEKLIPAEWVK